MSLIPVVQDDELGGRMRPLNPGEIPSAFDPICNNYIGMVVDAKTAMRHIRYWITPARWCPTAVGLYVTEAAGITVDPIVSLGVDGADADLVIETELTGLAAGRQIVWVPVAGRWVIPASGSIINLNIATAATGTTCNLTVLFKGFEVQT